MCSWEGEKSQKTSKTSERKEIKCRRVFSSAVGIDLSGTGSVSWQEFTNSVWKKTETPDQVGALTTKLKIILTFDLPLIAQWIFNSFYAKKNRFSMRAWSALLCSLHLPRVSCTLADFCSSPGNTGWYFSGSRSSWTQISSLLPCWQPPWEIQMASCSLQNVLCLLLEGQTAHILKGGSAPVTGMSSLSSFSHQIGFFSVSWVRSFYTTIDPREQAEENPTHNTQHLEVWDYSPGRLERVLKRYSKSGKWWNSGRNIQPPRLVSSPALDVCKCMK